MKKTVMANMVAAIVIATSLLPLLSCATSGKAGGLSLQDAIERAAERIADGLPAGTSLAVVSFESESDGLSDFIMETFNEAMMRGGIVVADRKNLDLAFRELDFGMSGFVSDETALSIGQILGTQFVVTGQFLDLGSVRRLSASAIQVETAIRQSAASFDVRNDGALREMIAALSRGTTRKTIEYNIP